MLNFRQISYDLIGVDKIQMGFYVGDKKLLSQSFDEYEEGSSRILKSNPWYRSRVAIMDDVNQFEKFFGFNNAVKRPPKKLRSLTKSNSIERYIN